VELFTVLLLLSGLAGLTLLQTGRARGQAGSLALAQEVAGNLRYCRALAISRGEPVAVRFPSGSGSRPDAAGFYLVAGEQKPAILRSHRSRRGTFFVGHWNLAAGTPGPGGQSAESTAQGFAAAAWLADQPGDRSLVFLPGGSVWSDLPTWNGQFHLLTCDGAQWVNAGLGGRPDWRLTAVSGATTLSVSPAGHIAVTSGVRNGPGVALNPALSASADAPLPPPAASMTALAPVITDVAVSPKPEFATLPAGIDATVEPDSYLTLEVVAQNPQAEPLFCTWSASNGTLSHLEETRMEWDGQRSAWVGRWVWGPPADTATGDEFTLTCTVRNPQGLTATGQVGVSGKIRALNRQRLFWVSDAGNPTSTLYVVNVDGSEPRRIIEAPYDVWHPRNSPDGRWIVFRSDHTGRRELYLATSDGASVRQLTQSLAWGWQPIYAEFHPNGTTVFCSGNNGNLYEIPWDGAAPRLVGGGFGNGFYSIHPAGQLVLRANPVSVLRLSDGTPVPLTRGPGVPAGFAEPSFSPSGTLLAWDTGPMIRLADFTYDGSAARLENARDVSPGTGCDTPRFSPDSTHILFQSDDGGDKDIIRVHVDGTGRTNLTDSMRSQEDEGLWVP
jgi:hypothetical protein